MNAPTLPPSDSPENAAVRRRVGQAALRRLIHLVEQDQAEERWKTWLAKRIGLVFALAAALLIGWLLFQRH